MDKQTLEQKINSGREYRKAAAFEVREEGEGENGRKVVTGYATTFGEEYLLYAFDNYRVVESVDRHAFDEADMQDTVMQYNHEGRVFARTRNHTLRVEPDDHGLRVEADLGGTELGRQVYDEIRGGYTDRMSFGFTVAADERTEEKEEKDGVTVYTLHRKITKIGKLYDVSAVSIPANDGTEISARAYADGVIAQAEAERLRAEQIERELNERRAKIKILCEV